jgi:serine/threonine-protein kinase
MATAGQNGSAPLDELERILSSSHFARSEGLSKLLRFLVERQIEGRSSELKESLIGVDVYGRKPDYDPKLDSTVRSEIARLRTKLATYYANEGHLDPLVIELPKGGYIPRFCPRGSIANGRSNNDAPTVTPRRNGRRLSLAVGTAALIVVAGSWLFRQNAPVRLAVLPFVNDSPDAANEYFADGLTYEIIRNLSSIEGLAVRSQTSSFEFKGKPRNVRESGRQLNADYILEGSVLRDRQKLRINVQLVRVRDDLAIWSGGYDRELTDAFEIQDEVSRGIVNSLRLKLGRGRRRFETSAEAYDLYIRAVAHGVRDEQRIDLVQRAIAKDPSFAPAYAVLANVYAVKSGASGSDRPDVLVKMRAAADKAIELDPLLAGAHDALGMAYSGDGQWARAERCFRRAIEIDPNASGAHSDYARFLLLPLGRIDEALQQMRLAEKADPLSPFVQFNVARVLLSAGRNKEAEWYCLKLPEDSVYNKKWCLGWSLLGQGRFGEAVHLLETSDRSTDRELLGYAYARAGRRADAEKLAAELSSDPFGQALTSAGLGDKDRTFQALNTMAGQVGPFRTGRALTWSAFDLLRGDPRLRALHKKVGLPE